MHREIMNTMTDLGAGIGYFARIKSLVDRQPRLTAIVSAERASCRNGNKHPLSITRVKDDRMQAHPARARLPKISLRLAQSGQLLPVLPTISRAE